MLKCGVASRGVCYLIYRAIEFVQNRSTNLCPYWTILLSVICEFKILVSARVDL